MTSSLDAFLRGELVIFSMGKTLHVSKTTVQNSSITVIVYAALHWKLFCYSCVTDTHTLSLCTVNHQNISELLVY